MHFINRVVILEPCEVHNRPVFAGLVQTRRVCTGELCEILSDAFSYRGLGYRRPGCVGI